MYLGQLRPDLRRVPHVGDGPLLGLLPVLAGGQGLLGLLQLLAQAVPLPVEDGELFLLLRRERNAPDCSILLLTLFAHQHFQ